ncbi:MAG: carbamoyltransferase HypF [Vulcanococcus sp.]
MAGTPEQRRLSLRLQGLVQGVGFRPHVHRLAQRLALQGWVRNGPDGVEMELEGAPERLQQFLDRLQAEPPAHCRIDALEARWGDAHGDLGAFRITPSTSHGPNPAATAAISPDLAICRACLAELRDPTNRRHRYPFISCTACGPRYSVLRQLPFEREHTSLAAFPLCAACRRDYADPNDRRFHAQTISCPACGPRLHWQGRDRGPQPAIAAAAAALHQGQIVALQGIGGFQLLVDPHNAAAVAELRRRKGRPDKPLALLAAPGWLERHCTATPQEEAVWWSAAAPIVLLRRRKTSTASQPLAAAVAGESPWLGVMRPASGLQQLLLEAWGGNVLVATSANRSGEPIAADPIADADRLAQLADGVLSHGLAIVQRIDDSVLRLAAGAPLILRLGRGLAPLTLPQPDRPQEASALALGAQLKGSLALQLPGRIVLSPDLGDVGSSSGAERLLHTTRGWLERHQLQPTAIACDAHPGYSARELAGDLARQRGLPLQPVQHHHAHLLAVLAEHGLNGEHLGIAWDGAGLGDDGSLWGGEALLVQRCGYRRLARLRPFPLPGGERALREPRRAALGLLLGSNDPHWRERPPALGARPWSEAFTPEERQVLEQAAQCGLNSPACSSIGRLFDAVAALLGVQQICSFEAQAAMALEGLASAAAESHAATAGAAGRGAIPRYELPLRPAKQPGLEWDWQPLLTAMLADIQRGTTSAAAIALAFHRALADGIAALGRHQHGASAGGTVLLGGGCFQNRLLLELSVAALRHSGLTPLWPQQLPCNDAALAVGQLLALQREPAPGIAEAIACHASEPCL